MRPASWDSVKLVRLGGLSRRGRRSSVLVEYVDVVDIRNEAKDAFPSARGGQQPLHGRAVAPSYARRCAR